MPLQIMVPDNDPLIPLLQERAVRRGLQEKDKKKLRRRLPKLARNLISERLSELNAHGDPMEIRPGAAG
jgi:hypothetical protein